MKSTVNQTHVRSINQRVILDSIFRVDHISRASLSRLLNLSKVAIAENLSYLLDLGIVQEVGTGESQVKGGRRPILLQFNKDYKYIVAIDLEDEDAVFSLANLAGEIQNKFTIQVSSSSSYSVRLELVENAISVLLTSSNLQPKDIAVIAISSPGIVHLYEDNYQANEQFQNWQMIELMHEIEACFAAHVMIANDVNAAAIGEFHYGAGITSHSLLYISCGLGVGAGIILDHKLHEGESKSAGEIANFITGAHTDYPVSLEKKINIEALLKRILHEAPENTLTALGHPNPFTFHDVVDLWQGGDEFINDCVGDIARNLGVAISNIISLLNVDLIVLGGQYRAFSKRILPLINRIVENSAFSPVPVVSSQLKGDASIYGLLTLARNKVFQEICDQNIK